MTGAPAGHPHAGDVAGALLHTSSDGTRLSAMPRYLTPEWVESFDAALGSLDLSDAVAAAGAGSLAAADGTFSVVQVVTKTGQSFEVAVGDMNLTLTPKLAAE